MALIPKEQETLFNMLIGMAETLEKIRDIVFTLEKKIYEIDSKLDSLTNSAKKKDYTSFGNKVSKWLKHTEK